MYDDVTDETMATAIELLVASRDEDEIAEALVDQGCQGHTGNPRSCPVARYLRAHFGRPDSIVFTVNGHRAAAFHRRDPLTEIASAEDLPWSLRRFVQQFDAEEFPYLIAR